MGCCMDRRMTREQRWLNECVPAKVGTVPMLIRLDMRRRIAIGARVRWQEICHGDYETGIVTNIEPLRIERH